MTRPQATRVTTLRNHYTALHAALNAPTWEIACDFGLMAGGCDPGDIAYVWSDPFAHLGGRRKIYVCEDWAINMNLGTNANDYDNMAGSLVHEWSHAELNTGDEVYGTANCQAYATSIMAFKRELTIQTADCLEYYAESQA